MGRKGARKLLGEGIRTARELRDADPGLIRKLLTVHGLNILMELRGIPSIGEDIPATHTCIISSRSLGYKVTTLEPMAEAIAFHAARAAEKLRAKKLVTQVVAVRIQTPYYVEDQPGHDEMTMVRLERPTSDSSVILAAARRGLERIFKYGYGYAKAMVMLTDLSDPAKGQPHMLGMLNGNAARDARRGRLLEVVDRINRTQGRGTLRFAAQGSKDARWHMAPAVATKEATDASSVVTQETTLEDSLRNDMATLLQPLSPSVSPSGNGCRGDSNWLPHRPVNATTVAIRKARKLADGWRKRGNLSLAWTTDSGELLQVGGVRGVYRATPDAGQAKNV